MNRDFGLVLNPPVISEALTDLPRVLEATGIRRLVVPAVHGPSLRLSFGDSTARPVASPGGWLFDPASEHFASTRIRPRLLRPRGIAERLLEHVSEIGAGVVFRVALRGAPGVVDHADAQQRNAWGDVTAAGACVSDPDVRAVLRATFRDLARFSPLGFEVEDWALDRPIAGGRTFLPWHPAASRCLNTCFCESCRQLALDRGGDPEGAARSVRVRFDRALRVEPDRCAAATDDDVVLREYCALRSAANEEWLTTLAQDCGGAQLWWIAADGRTPPGWSALAELTRSAAEGSTADVESSAAALIAGGAAIKGLVVPVWRPWISDAAALIRVLAIALDAGAAYVDFAGAVSAPLEATDWLATAIRFGRRRQ